MLNQRACDYVAETAAKPTRGQLREMRLSRGLVGTDLGRSWAADRLPDVLDGLVQEEDRRRHAASKARVAKSRSGDEQLVREGPGLTSCRITG